MVVPEKNAEWKDRQKEGKKVGREGGRESASETFALESYRKTDKLVTRGFALKYLIHVKKVTVSVGCMSVENRTESCCL